MRATESGFELIEILRIQNIDDRSDERDRNAELRKARTDRQIESGMWRDEAIRRRRIFRLGFNIEHIDHFFRISAFSQYLLCTICRRADSIRIDQIERKSTIESP